jgi:hypothetical protein
MICLIRSVDGRHGALAGVWLAWACVFVFVCACMCHLASYLSVCICGLEWFCLCCIGFGRRQADNKHLQTSSRCSHRIVGRNRRRLSLAVFSLLHLRVRVSSLAVEVPLPYFCFCCTFLRSTCNIVIMGTTTPKHRAMHAHSHSGDPDRRLLKCTSTFPRATLSWSKSAWERGTRDRAPGCSAWPATGPCQWPCRGACPGRYQQRNRRRKRHCGMLVVFMSVGDCRAQHTQLRWCR